MAKMAKMTNEITETKIGDIIIVPDQDRVTIGKLLNYNHPYVSIEGVAIKFPENITYKATLNRLTTLGVPSKMAEGIMSGELDLPIIGEG